MALGSGGLGSKMGLHTFPNYQLWSVEVGLETIHDQAMSLVLEWLESINFRLESKGDLEDGRFLKANGIGNMSNILNEGCWARFCDSLVAGLYFGLGVSKKKHEK